MADIQAFVAQYGPAAAASAAQLGTTPQNVLGHWGLETGWGQHVIPGTNNMGNIKSTDGSGIAATDNQNGSRDNYAAYATPEAAAQGYTNLLSNQRYAGVRGAQDPSAFAAALKQGGYAEDPNYVSKLVSTINAVQGASGVPSIEEQKAALAKQVTEDYAAGTDPMTIIQGLLKTNIAGADVMSALKKGVDPQKIISVVGGAPLAHFIATDPAERVKQQGFLTNLGQGASQAVGDLGQGAKQIGARLSGNDAQLAQLQTQQQTAEADPARQALSHTWGGNIGKLGVDAVPYALAAAGTAVAPEIGLPVLAAINAGVGGAEGALTPTTGEGQFGKNIALSALLAGAPVAGAGLLSKAAGAVPAVLGGDAEAIAARTAAADALRTQGLPVNAITLTDAGKNIASHIPDNGAIQAFRDATDATIAAKVGEGLGLKGYTGPIDTDMLNTARPAIKQALDDATNVQVTLPQSLKTDLQGLLGSAKNPLTEGIATNGTVNTAAGNLIKAADAGTAVSGRQLQDLASELKAVASNPGASATERTTAGQMVGKVNNVLTSSMTPQQAAAFNAANSQYANMKAVEKMVTASSDTGTVTPRQMLNAVKSGRFKTSFLQGEAPFQELSGAASDALGPANGKGLSEVLGRSMGGHDLTTAMALEPTHALPYWAAKKLVSMLAGNALTSENPTVVRLLTGVGGTPAMNAAQNHYIARALGGTIASAND